MFKPFRKFSAVLTTVFLLAGMGAQAATVSFSTTLPNAAVANPLASGTFGTADLDENVTGTFVNERRSPWDATNSAVVVATGLYSSIRSTTATPATTYFSFTDVMKELSFVWGTPGPQNKVELFLGGISQYAFFGNTVIDGTSAQTLSAGGNLSILTTIADLRFDRLEFSAGKPALEFANLTTVAAVPLPAAGMMLLGALGCIAALRRRKTAA